MSSAAVRTAGRTAVASRPSLRHAEQGARVGFFGLFGIGNFGNDGSLEAMIGVVRRARPDARLVCICDGPDRLQQTLGIEALPIKLAPPSGLSSIIRRLLIVLAIGPNLIRAIAHTRKLDVLIVPGTGVLDDFCCGPTGVPMDVFTWCIAAWLMRTPIWFISIGAGPIVHPLSRRLMVWAAKLAQFRSYRDANSKRFLSEAGVRTQRDLVFPDLAFDLARPDPVTPCADQSLTVGVGVMNYRGWNDTEHSSAIHSAYRDSLVRFCIWLLETGYRIRLLPGDDTDSRAISSLKLLLELRLPDRVLLRNVVAEPAHNLADVMRQMAGTDVVVATRYHNVVCALKMDKPTLSLSYAEKNAALLKDAGLGDYTQEVEGFDVERLKEQFRQLMSERELLAARIADFNALTKRRLRNQGQLLQDRLLALQSRQPASAKRPGTAPGHDG